MPWNMPTMEVASSRVWALDTNIHVRGEGDMTTLPLFNPPILLFTAQSTLKVVLCLPRVILVRFDSGNC